MHTVSILRNFARRSDDKAIGECRLTGEAKLVLDGQELPATSVEYLLTFALQSLQDAYAGAASYDDAVKAWTDKRAKLLEGTIGTRGPGASVPEEVRVGREIARDKLRTAGGDKWKAYKAADTDGRTAILDDILSRNAEAFTKLVTDEIKRRRAAKAKLAEVAIEL